MDEGAFNELSASLRQLIERAQDAQRSLTDQLSIGKRAADTLDKIRPEIHRQTSAANRLVEVLASSVQRLDAMIQRAQTKTMMLESTEERIAAAIESRLQWFEREIEQRVDAAIQRATHDLQPVVDKAERSTTVAKKLCDGIDQRAKALDEHTERAISAAGRSIDAEIKALDETVRTMSDRAVSEAIDRTSVQETLGSITSSITAACDSAQQMSESLLAEIDAKIHRAKQQAEQVGAIDFGYLSAVCDRAQTFIGDGNTTDEASPANTLASLIDRAESATRVLATANNTAASYKAQAESAKQTMEASLLASAEWLDNLHDQHKELDKKIQQSLLECEQVRLLAESRTTYSAADETQTAPTMIAASEAEPKPIKPIGTVDHSLASAMIAWDEFVDEPGNESASEDNHLAELVEPCVTFIAGDVGDAIEREGLDDVAGHDGAVRQCGAEDSEVREDISDFPFLHTGSKIAHHATSEGIAGTGGIDDRVAGERGDSANAIAMDKQAPVLALLHDDKLWPHGGDLASRSNGVGQAGELLGLVIVENKPVDLAHEGIEFGTGGVDPEIHSVGDRKRRLLNLFQQAHLDRGMRVGEKDKLGVSVLRWDSGRLLDQDVEFGVEGLAGVHVLEILPAPAEGLGSLACFKSLKPDVRHVLEHRAKLIREIIADNTDDAYVGVMLRSRGEVGTRTAEHVLSMLAGRGVDGINANGSGDNQGHGNSLSLSSFSLVNAGSAMVSHGLCLRAGVTSRMLRSLPR